MIVQPHHLGYDVFPLRIPSVGGGHYNKGFCWRWSGNSRGIADTIGRDLRDTLPSSEFDDRIVQELLPVNHETDPDDIMI